jgi:phospholipid transport system substrate-binding protein
MGQPAMKRVMTGPGWGALAMLLVGLPFAARAEAPTVPAAGEAPAQFVDIALHETLSALATPSEAAPSRSERLRAVLIRYFDVAEVGRNSVGPAWQLVAPAQQADFLATFESFLVASYVGALGRASDLSFGPSHVIVASAAEPAVAKAAIARTLVRVDVLSAEGPPHPVLIALSRADDGSYRIVDVSAEAVSLGRLLSADFGAFLRRNGGRLDALVTVLRDKIAARIDGH